MSAIFDNVFTFWGISNNVLVSFEVGAESIKTFIKQKYFHKIVGTFLTVVVLKKCALIFTGINWRLFKSVLVPTQFHRTLIEGSYYLVLSRNGELIFYIHVLSRHTWKDIQNIDYF